MKDNKVKSKWIVEVWEHRRVSFEVEADNEDEAMKVASDVYQNDESLQSDMVSDDGSIVHDEVKVIGRIEPETGIVARKC